MQTPLVLIIGASDLGTACILRLARAGMRILVLENDHPIDLYHSRSFSAAGFSGKRAIEDVTARTFANAISEEIISEKSSIMDFVKFQLANREVPFITNLDQIITGELDINYVVISSNTLNEKFYKQYPDGSKIIGFSNALDGSRYTYTICNKGLNLGRVIYPFNSDNFYSEEPKREKNNDVERIKAPIEGVFKADKTINDLIHEKEKIGTIAEIPILSPTSGRVTGILNSGIIIPAGIEFVEINSSPKMSNGNNLSQISFCLAGGALEAILYDLHLETFK